MKEFFKNKRNIAIVASVLALVLAITGVVIYQTNKPEVEDPGKTPKASENVSGEARTEENTADAAEESATAEPSTEKQTESTTAKKETSTTVPNKKPENKPVTTTKPHPTKPETTTKPATNSNIKNPITGEPVPGMDEESYRLSMEKINDRYGSIEGYKAEVERVKSYKCNHCGKHDCPSINYGKDSFGNTVNMSFFFDKCPAIINHTSKCKHCGKPIGTFNEVTNHPEKYCSGNCNISFE